MKEERKKQKFFHIIAHAPNRIARPTIVLKVIIIIHNRRPAKSPRCCCYENAAAAAAATDTTDGENKKNEIIKWKGSGRHENEYVPSTHNAQKANSALLRTNKNIIIKRTREHHQKSEQNETNMYVLSLSFGDIKIKCSFMKSGVGFWPRV